LKNQPICAIIEYTNTLTLKASERMGKMAVSYKKLWHILLDKDMKKKDLQEAAGLTKYAINKLSRDEDVTTEILGKICKTLDCTTDDIMEFLPDEK